MKTYTKIIEEANTKYYPDAVEFTKGSVKLTVSINIDRPEQAIRRIDEGLGIREYALNAFMMKVEKLANKEKKA
jgi:hypothetical protein